MLLLIRSHFSHKGFCLPAKAPLICIPHSLLCFHIFYPCLDSYCIHVLIQKMYLKFGKMWKDIILPVRNKKVIELQPLLQYH